MDLNHLLSAELPDDARALYERCEAQVSIIQSAADQEAEAIRRRAEKEVGNVQEQAERQIKAQRQQLIEVLRTVQNAHARAGRFDEAVAVHERLRWLAAAVVGVRSDPGYLGLEAEDVGKSFLYDVTGCTQGPLWGSEVYTADSSLATAAVHAGLLRPGERGLVKLTVASGCSAYEGSRRHGVHSSAWGSYPLSFRLAKP
jgi:hypothetical protein